MYRYTKWMLLLISLAPHAWAEDLESSAYFNTEKIANSAAMQTQLKQDGFIPVSFTSTDGFALNGLLLERPAAKVTVICCGGFFPGRKEGMASFFKLLPDYCNILLFDARGHGESQGYFISNVHNYGLNEYKDILGASEFIHARTQKPVILLGICIGTLHATHAILHLQKDTRTNKPTIIGFVCDSGVGSISEVSHLPINRFHEKTLPNFIGNFYVCETKEEIKNTWAYALTKCSLSPFTYSYKLILGTALRVTEKQTNTYDKIHEISCPIFFIHAKNDDGTPFERITKLCHNVPNKTCWWIETSKHGCNHLKHKHAYRAQLHSFVNKVTDNLTNA